VPEKKDVPTVVHPRNILMGCKHEEGSWGSWGKPDSHAGSPHQNEKCHDPNPDMDLFPLFITLTLSYFFLYILQLLFTTIYSPWNS
jgi:hypothetical protein